MRIRSQNGHGLGHSGALRSSVWLGEVSLCGTQEYNGAATENASPVQPPSILTGPATQHAVDILIGAAGRGDQMAFAQMMNTNEEPSPLAVDSPNAGRLGSPDSNDIAEEIGVEVPQPTCVSDSHLGCVLTLGIDWRSCAVAVEAWEHGRVRLVRCSALVTQLCRCSKLRCQAVFTWA